MSKLSKNKSGMKSKSDSYKESPAFLALTKALDNGRLPHAILLHSDNIEVLKDFCFQLSEKLLSTQNTIESHPDFFSLRPTNKMRQINAESVRELIKQIQHTPSQANRKVAAIYEADRMNLTAANAFLKTLEEPPLDTTIFLLTSRPYALLDTIRSRCLNFRLPIKQEALDNDTWTTWKSTYTNWIYNLAQSSHSKKDIEKHIMEIYKMIVHFEQILEHLSDEQWTQTKNTLDENLSDEETLAEQSGILKSIRHRLFKEIEQTTYHSKIQHPSPPTIKKLTQVIAELERLTKLIEVNFNEYTALETFLLYSLRTWAT
ncbi:MAG: DNA polymerase III subunit gamma/tau [Verrucomicrobia bacterium]|nr:MAG: DNA polymerase III subunit gamma/tau [Verrucomicrobiota bacterium]